MFAINGYKIREISSKFSKEIVLEKRREECNLFLEISEYCDENELNSEDKDKLQVRRYVHGAFVRSRAEWIEQGEKTSSDSNLEKRGK